MRLLNFKLTKVNSLEFAKDLKNLKMARVKTNLRAENKSGE